MKRREDRPLVMGEGEFIDDRTISNMVYAAVGRSPYAHAYIEDIDPSGARSMEGVIDVITARDIDGDYTPMESGSRLVRGTVMPSLAVDKVRYSGEPVFVVLADDRYRAEDALEEVEVVYDPIESIVTWEEALDAPALLHEDWENNLSLDHEFQHGDVDGAFEGADRVFEERFQVQRHGGIPIEPRGLIAQFNEATGQMNVWSTTQTPYWLRTWISQGLDLDEKNIRVIVGNIGGGFGPKADQIPLQILIPLLAKRYDVPVKWVETRSEHMKTMHAKEQTHDIQVAVDEDGTIRGIRDSLKVDLGGYVTMAGPIEGINAASFLPGCYKIQNYAFDLKGVVTNKAPLGPYRGFGKSAPNFVIERTMDRISRELGLDVAEIRAKNLVDEFPHRNPVGAVYRSGSYRESLEDALEELNYEQQREKQAREREDGKLLGIGLSCAIDPTGQIFKDAPLSGYDGVTLRMNRSGSITALTGACGKMGTNHETTFSELIGETLGVSPETVEVVEGDTQLCPEGQGSYSDRSVFYTASAAQVATTKLREKILAVAAEKLEADPKDLEITEGKVHPKGSRERELSMRDVAFTVYNQTVTLPDNVEAGLESTHYFSIRQNSINMEYFPSGDRAENFYPCFGNSCHAVLCEVDPETGEVDLLRYVMVSDAGTVLNEEVVEGQLVGGIVAGVGASLMEEFEYDERGQLISGTFKDYAMPRATDIPEQFDISHNESPTPLSPVGAKGIGEAGTIGSYAAIANAVEDALEPFDAKVQSLPLNQDKVWKLIHENGD